jgi:hypothetical protein
MGRRDRTVTQRYAPTFDDSAELYSFPVSSDLVKFCMIEPFEVDGVWYDPSTRTNVSRLMVQINDADDEHVCRNWAVEEGLDPSACSFDGAADGESRHGECLSRAFRWRPGMVYYRSKNFDTPIHGG